MCWAISGTEVHKFNIHVKRKMAEIRGESTVQISLPGSYSVTYPVVQTSHVCKRRGDGITLTEAKSMGDVLLQVIYCGQRC